MTYEEFQIHFEKEAEEEKNNYLSLSISELISKLKNQEFGKYYTLWYALADRANLEDIGWDLFSVLTSDHDYLIRYHCAAALLQLLGMQLDSLYKPEKLSGNDKYNIHEWLTGIKDILESKIGTAPNQTLDLTAG